VQLIQWVAWNPSAHNFRAYLRPFTQKYRHKLLFHVKRIQKDDGIKASVAGVVAGIVCWVGACHASVNLAQRPHIHFPGGYKEVEAYEQFNEWRSELTTAAVEDGGTLRGHRVSETRITTLDRMGWEDRCSEVHGIVLLQVERCSVLYCKVLQLNANISKVGFGWGESW
jgi:hypothetical protein